ncbi:hypothetical protein [Arthrobacter sp. UYCo732]|uniref:DUF7455 domain-containing protein n=1 Tax=Arthrobacter sp. UYCo732 TaxID=3156336 RepID=UPI0033931257
MTTDTLTKPLSKLAVELNEHLKTQSEERTLHRLDICDRCPQAAQSIFTFRIADADGGEGAEMDIILCGHHTRQHLPAMLSKNPATYWIEPQELLSIRGINVESTGRGKTGDGLTDGSR